MAGCEADFRTQMHMVIMMFRHIRVDLRMRVQIT